MLQRRFWMRGGGSGLTALGAGFLLNDRSLEPLLAGTLLLTVLIAGLHLRRHHQPGPFLLSLISAGSVFFAIYGIGLLPHARAEITWLTVWLPPPAGVHTWPMERSSSRLRAQVWDLWLYRRCMVRAAPVPADSAPDFSETRKERV